MLFLMLPGITSKPNEKGRKLQKYYQQDICIFFPVFFLVLNSIYFYIVDSWSQLKYISFGHWFQNVYYPNIISFEIWVTLILTKRMLFNGPTAHEIVLKQNNSNFIFIGFFSGQVV